MLDVHNVISQIVYIVLIGVPMPPQSVSVPPPPVSTPTTTIPTPSLPSQTVVSSIPTTTISTSSVATPPQPQFSYGDINVLSLTGLTQHVSCNESVSFNFDYSLFFHVILMKFDVF